MAFYVQGGNKDFSSRAVCFRGVPQTAKRRLKAELYKPNTMGLGLGHEDSPQVQNSWHPDGLLLPGLPWIDSEQAQGEGFARKRQARRPPAPGRET
jgi:hypothetical protein